MGLKLYEREDAPEGLVKVKICEGKAESPFSEGSGIVPDGINSIKLYVSRDEERFYMKAARALSGFGVFKLELDCGDIPFDFWDGYRFVTALYDGKHDIEAALPLKKSELSRIRKIYKIVSAARELADTGSSVATPVYTVKTLAKLCEKAASESGGKVKVTIIKNDDKRFDDYQGLKAVGAGSSVTACMGIIDYLPEGCHDKDTPVDTALVGKGITFDSGGYNIKPDRFMEDMRTDKTGAVNLGASLALAITLGLKKRVRAYLACSRNSVSAESFVPGDIIKFKNGISVEINNTDAEGRLVLADALYQASEDGAANILDAATLTGSAKYAVGRDMCCLFARGNKVDEGIKRGFEQSGEPYWQMPLMDYHHRFLKSRRADVTNSGSGTSAPGASVAASFLEMFVDKKASWTHIDLSSAYLPDGSPFLCAGPTGAIIVPVALWLTEEK